MTQEEKYIINKTLELLHDYYLDEANEYKKNNKPVYANLKEEMYDDFFEFGNGVDTLLFEEIKKRWDNE